MQNYGAYLLSWWGVFWSPLQDYGRNSMPQSIPWMHRLPLQLVPKHQDASFYACRKMGDTERREALSHHLQLLSGRLVNFWIHTTDTVTLYKLGGGDPEKDNNNKEGFLHVSAQAFVTVTAETEDYTCEGRSRGAIKTNVWNDKRNFTGLVWNLSTVMESCWFSFPQEGWKSSLA